MAMHTYALIIGLFCLEVHGYILQSTKISLRVPRTALQAQTREGLEESIAQFLATVPASDAQAWFRHCGYALR
jgi:hypothetical protein